VSEAARTKDSVRGRQQARHLLQQPLIGLVFAVLALVSLTEAWIAAMCPIEARGAYAASRRSSRRTSGFNPSSSPIETVVTTELRPAVVQGFFSLVEAPPRKGVVDPDDRLAVGWPQVRPEVRPRRSGP